jgi:thioesterase domain-containing protein/acyl carrier protein
MMPAAYVLLEALPVTSNGKIDRQALPSPDPSRDNLDSGYVAPVDEVEQTLTQIWERLLNVHQIGMRDNFFELGGHSLLAVRLLTEIEQTFGVRLALIRLFQEATIGQLARLIRQQTELTPWPSLVALQPQGSKPPFFCIHGITGDILWFKDLAHRLAPDQPFYGIQARGLDRLQPPLEQIEAMAAVYLEEIRQIQPAGPYYLGGASFGGTVAFEMAQQLLAMGQQVALLGMFDNELPNLEQAVGPHRLTWQLTLAGKFIANFPHWLANFIQLRPEQMWVRLRRQIRSFAREVKAKLNPTDVEMNPITAEDIIDYAAELPEHRRLLIESHYRALNHYQPKAYPGRITLFQAQARPLFSLFYPELGWKRLALNGVEVKQIPGSHEGMFKEPYVQILAEELRRCIETTFR